MGIMNQLADLELAKIVATAFVTSTVALAIVILNRGQRIKELSGELHSSRAQYTQLRGQMDEAKRDHDASLAKLTNQRDAAVQREQDEVAKLHRQITELKEELNIYEDQNREMGG